jgi:transmembrane secretion effector
VPALRAGGRYVRHSPVVHRILLRLAWFVMPAICLWALLPLVARQRLGLGAPGYGLLLAALGVGALAGAVALPWVRARLAANQVVAVASLAYAGVLVVLGTVPSVPLVALALLPAGAAWLTVTSSISAALQLVLPGWVRARAISTYQVVDAGCQALGAFLWGSVAQMLGLTAAYLGAAGLLLVGAATIRGRPLLDTRHVDPSPAVYWPEPDLGIDPEPSAGPVVVQTTYTVLPEQQEPFLDAMREVRRARLRTGARSWDLHRAGESPDRFIEAYQVPSWAEHLRQHGGRLTGSDRLHEERAVALAAGEPEVLHLFPADHGR